MLFIAAKHRFNVQVDFLAFKVIIIILSTNPVRDKYSINTQLFHTYYYPVLIQGAVDSILTRASRTFWLEQKIELYHHAIKMCQYHGLHTKKAAIHCMLFNLYFQHENLSFAMSEAKNAISTHPTYGDVSYNSN